jgi:hypothetical protein
VLHRHRLPSVCEQAGEKPVGISPVADEVISDPAAERAWLIAMLAARTEQHRNQP